MTEREDAKGAARIFDQDVGALGGYRYTSEDRLSTRLSNGRMSRGIAEAASYEGKAVLDVGCGDGTFTLELAELGAKRVLGVDPAERAVEVARERARECGYDQVSFAVGDAYHLDRLEGAFDTVVLRGVLHHLPDPRRAVAAAVARAGEVVVLEPNGANPVLKIIEKLSPYHVRHEERSFLPSTLRKWLIAAGATVEHEQFINLVPIFCPAPLARLLKYCEPLAEAPSLLRSVACGQYVVRARKHA